MGHIAGKDIYRTLGKKIDNLSMRVPWNERFREILIELYSEDEAELFIKMPYGLSSFDRIKKVTKYESSKLHKILNSLCSKGLVIDLRLHDNYYYMPSPMVIGIFEFTMMRTGDGLDTKKWARLLNQYMQEDGSFYHANLAKGEKISFMRTLPHEEVITPSEFIEVLDYEKAWTIIKESDKFSIGLCSCRHEKLHLGEKKCDVPLDTCSSFGMAAEFLIRNNLAKEVSKSEMLENLARSKEIGLVLNADNVQRNVTYICHCCKCCCNALLGISKHGYPNTIVTSNFIAQVNEELCKGCGKCAKACPVNAIELRPVTNASSDKGKRPVIDKNFCLGCGVCALKCETKALSLVKRDKRVIYPETTFERIILQCLEKGTLQYQIFDNPQDINQKIMRAFLGAFLRLPLVKKALMSDMLQSSFLDWMKKGVGIQGKDWITKI
jgi:Pyruvate/2-oxoacid:ferredoxin oxidoreductase delta subunit